MREHGRGATPAETKQLHRKPDDDNNDKYDDDEDDDDDNDDHNDHHHEHQGCLMSTMIKR